MIKGLGHLIRFMFGGKRPLPASAANMVGAMQHDLVEAPAASTDVLRRAMEAAEAPSLEAENFQAEGRRLYAPVAEDLDSLPTLFLHGVAAEPASVKIALEYEKTIEPVTEDRVEFDDGVEAEESIAVDEAPGAEMSPAWEPVILVPALEAESSMEWEQPSHEYGLVSSFDPIEPANASVEQLADQPVEDSRSIEDQGAAQEAEPAIANTIALEANEVEPAVDAAAAVSAQVETIAAEATSPVPEVALAEEAIEKPTKKRAPAKKTQATTKRKKASEKPDAPALADDAVFLTDAVIWSQCGSWREFWLPPTDANTSQRIDEFRQLAANGKLTIWGLVGSTEAWVAIAPAHWKKNGFDPLSFLTGRENAFSQAGPTKSKAKKPAEPVKYSSLKVSKAQVEALWQTGIDAAQVAA